MTEVAEQSKQEPRSADGDAIVTVPTTRGAAAEEPQLAVSPRLARAQLPGHLPSQDLPVSALGPQQQQ